jgi:hypothetical protein
MVHFGPGTTVRKYRAGALCPAKCTNWCQKDNPCDERGRFGIHSGVNGKLPDASFDQESLQQSGPKLERIGFVLELPELVERRIRSRSAGVGQYDESDPEKQSLDKSYQ